MDRLKDFASLRWQHPFWEMVKFYRGMSRGAKKKREWLRLLKTEHLCSFPGDDTLAIPIDSEISNLLEPYIEASDAQSEKAFDYLRTEEEAIAHCKSLGVSIGKTRTKSTDHHQSSKALVGAVTFIAVEFCSSRRISIDPDPQNRCVWAADNSVHVTARRLDGAIPGLVNPSIVWEIKEYWGKTSGGSKMSDAVYECQLVGRELRNWEEESRVAATHVVFLDGLDQWKSRRSDFVRFTDLVNQGLIDHLLIGREVETQWKKLLDSAL